jgi:programmed cell death protein 5
MLNSILTPEAKDRLERVAMVRPDNARAVEAHIMQLARARKLQEKVGEETLVAMLEQVSKQSSEQSAVRKVTIVRKKRAGEDSDDEDDFDL